jgi:hypothetical protein
MIATREAQLSSVKGAFERGVNELIKCIKDNLDAHQRRGPESNSHREVGRSAVENHLMRWTRGTASALFRHKFLGSVVLKSPSNGSS